MIFWPLIFSKSSDYGPFFGHVASSQQCWDKGAKIVIFLIGGQNRNILKFRGRKVQFSLSLIWYYHPDFFKRIYYDIQWERNVIFDWFPNCIGIWCIWYHVVEVFLRLLFINNYFVWWGEIFNCVIYHVYVVDCYRLLFLSRTLRNCSLTRPIPDFSRILFFIPSKINFTV